VHCLLIRAIQPSALPCSSCPWYKETTLFCPKGGT
jgi:hypothetical protein